MVHNGSCHCGRIAFEVDGEVSQLMECNCSHCSRKGVQMWFVAKSQLRLLTPAKDMATYTFNRHVIQHHFCPVCGCAPFGFGKDPKKGIETAAVNARCLPELDRSKIKIVHFDGKSL